FLPPELSDAMCRLSSGGTLAKRVLYTDADEFVISACRPQLLNGIPDTLASRSDLLDRSILLKAPAIANCDRKAEEEFWREFEEAVVSGPPLAVRADRTGIIGVVAQLPHVLDYHVDAVRVAFA